MANSEFLDKAGLVTLWERIQQLVHECGDKGYECINDTVITSECFEEAVLSVTNDIFGTVKGIKGNSESSYRTGNVNLTLANIGVHISTAEPTSADGNDGDLWIKYTEE